MASARTFTSYINAALEPNAEASFDRLAASATKSYGAITRAALGAELATKRAASAVSAGGNARQTSTIRAAAGLSGGGRSTAGGGATRAQTQGFNNVGRAADAASRSTDRAGRSLAAYSRETSNAAKRQTVLTNSLRATATTLNIAQGPLGPIAGRVNAIAGALENLTGFRLGIAGVGAALFGLGRAGVAFTNIESRLKPLYDSQVQVNAAMDDIVGIANRARTSLEPIVDLYVKITSAGEDLGISAERAARLTELASKAAILSGGSRQAQEAGLLQFSQALGSGNLGGEELRSVKENTFALAQAIAKGFENADGSIGTTIGNLKKLAEQGELTSDRVAAALERSAGSIDAKFAKMPITLGQAVQSTSNNLTVLVGRLDSTLGLTSGVARGIALVGDNLRLVGAIAIGAAAAFGAIKVAPLLAGVSALAAQAKQAAAYPAAVNRIAQARLAAATASQAQHTREVAALTAERTQIQSNIAALETKRRLAASDRARALNQPNPSARLAAAAANEERAAVRGLAGERQRLGVITAATTAANGRLAASNTAVAVATRNASAASGVFGRTVRGLLGVFNPYALLIGGVVTLLIAYASRTTNAEIATRGLTAAQRDAIDAIDAQTEAYERQTQAIRDNRRNKAAEGAEAAQTDLNARRNSLAAQVRVFGEYARLSEKDRATVAAIGRAIEQSTSGDEIARQYERLQQIRNRNPRANDAGLGFKAGAKEVDEEFAEFRKASERLRYNKQNYRELTAKEEAIQSTRGGNRPAAATAAELRAKAIVEAEDDGTDSIRAAGARRTAAYKELDREFGVKGGKVDPARAAEYQERSRQIESTYKGEVEAIKAGAAAARQARADARKAETAERGAARKAEAAEAKRVRDAATMGEKRSDILSGYDAAPRAIDRARDQIEDLQAFVDKAVDGVAFVGKTRAEVEKIKEINPLGRGIYTQEMADADAANIERGVRKPIADATLEYERQRQITDLIIQGRDQEAEAHRRAYELADQVGELNEQEYQTILDQVKAEESRNFALERRQRIVSTLQGMVDTARDATAELIEDLGSGEGFRAVGNFFKNLQRSATRAFARQITEKIFAGADEKVAALIRSRAPVEQATAFFAGKLSETGEAAGNLAAALNNAAAAATGAPAGTGGGLPGGGTPIGGLGGIFNILTGAIPAVAKIAVAETVDKQEDIIVSGRRPAGPPQQPKDQKLPNAKEVGRTITGSATEFLDKTFKTGTFFKGIGEGVSKAFGGAAKGQFASGVARSLGIKQSNTGAQIGGAIGAFIPQLGPLGPFIGGLIGGTLGGLLKKTKTGTATIGAGGGGGLDITGTGGNSAKFKAQSSAAADSIIGAAQQLAEQLGGGIEANRATLSVGVRDGKLRLDTSGRGQTKKSRGAIDFGEDEQGLIEAAMRDLISDGVITGISQASQNILRAGRNLQVQIEKAALIESIPRRLLQRTDPVRYAVEEINREFGKMIAALKEGGGTAEQFADAQKLYELERAEAIKQATQQAGTAIDQFLKDMVGGNNSPLNRRTVYANAQKALDDFRTDISAGKVVDQQELLSAARNFQEASRSLNGSSQAFFSDFDSIFQLLTKARDNAGLNTNVTNLPASPFASDASVQQAIANANDNQVGAIQDQTAALLAGLGGLPAAIAAALGGVRTTAGSGGSALSLMPMVREK